MKVAVIITAGGKGERFGGEMPKQFIELKGKPIIIHTIERFSKISEVESIVIPVHSEWFTYTKELIAKYDLPKVKDVVVGGKERQDSIYNALQSNALEEMDIVMVHDSVRPFVDEKLINKIIDLTEDYGAVIAGTTPKDPVKEINTKGEINRTIQRNKVSISQTPQSFWKDIIKTAYQKAREVNYIGSDSAQLVEFLGYKVLVVEGSEYNIKITTQFDLKLAELIYDEILIK